MPEDCLFCRMAAGQVPVEKVAEDEHVFAIRDINPRAPKHVLIIPRVHIPSVLDIKSSHQVILSHLFAIATKVADIEGVAERGYRLAFNCGEDGGQTIYHVHMHLLGGRRLGPEG